MIGTTVYEAALSDARCELETTSLLIDLLDSVTDSAYSIDDIHW